MAEGIFRPFLEKIGLAKKGDPSSSEKPGDITPPENAQTVRDYSKEVGYNEAMKYLPVYEQRLASLEDPNTSAIQKLTSLTANKWEKGEEPDKAIQREIAHVRARIAQCERALKKAA